MDLISKGKIVEIYNEETKLDFSANGEEYKLVLSTFNLIKESVEDKHQHPNSFGGSGSTPLNISGHLAKEQGDIDSFPDCVLINKSEIICIEHTKIDASKARKKKGSIYQQCLGKTGDLSKVFGSNFPESFNTFLANSKIEFSVPNLCQQLMNALNKKVGRIPKYKGAIAKHIQSGANKKFIQEDLSKPIFAWLFIEDISPSTSFDSLFTNEKILKFLEKHSELNGIIYLHHPDVFSAPRYLCEVVLIFNNSSALKELRAMR